MEKAPEDKGEMEKKQYMEKDGVEEENLSRREGQQSGQEGREEDEYSECCEETKTAKEEERRRLRKT